MKHYRDNRLLSTSTHWWNVSQVMKIAVTWSTTVHKKNASQGKLVQFSFEKIFLYVSQSKRAEEPLLPVKSFYRRRKVVPKCRAVHLTVYCIFTKCSRFHVWFILLEVCKDAILIPKPITESHVSQSCWLLPKIPIRDLRPCSIVLPKPRTLNIKTFLVAILL